METPEDKFRRLKGLGRDVPVPISLESLTYPEGEARIREMKAGGQPMQAPAPASAGIVGAAASRPMRTVESARAVLDKAATGADIATIGLAAGGVTAPIAGAAKTLGWVAEGGLGLINAYDGVINGNWAPLEAQGASLPARLLSCTEN